MTAATLPAAPARAPRLGLAWLVWRQHRAAAAGVIGLFGAATVLLVATGLRIHAGYHTIGLDACQRGSLQCGDLLRTFTDRYGAWGLYLPRLLMFLPAVVGAFVGGPLVAREFESGTVRFVWTQGRGRMRWLAATLGSVLAFTTLAALGLSLLFGWWFRPYERTLGRLGSAAFELGPLFAARTLLGVALGALAGTLIRRTVPAMAATLAGWLAVVVPGAVLWRPHYRAPLATLLGAGPDDPRTGLDIAWTLRTWWTDAAGRVQADDTVDRLAREAGAQGQRPAQWVAEHGYLRHEAYQPDGRFWTFQWIEVGWTCALAAALVGLTVWLVRRAG